MSEPILELKQICKRFGQTVVADRFSLTIYRGEFFTLLGPSGSGKSTILRIVAGLEQPDEGRVLIAGKDVAPIPPWRRGLGIVFQQYALFPHMSVAQNVGYGMQVRGVSPSRTREKVRELLKLVGLEGFEDKDVTLLSGGERQRVALARALAIEPPLLLLDEPLSALDEKVRREMQIELKRIHRETGTTFIYVTHDQEEALTMSDRIGVINRGILEQCDVPERVFRRPRTRFVAGFFRGCNVLKVAYEKAQGGALILHIGDQLVAVDAPGAPGTDRPHLAIAIRAENLRVGSRAGECSVQLAATLKEVVYRGTNVDHVLELPDGQPMVATSIQQEAKSPGQKVILGFNAEDIVILEG
jgi:ABC-type Fe3+/spermidine/putrescine transport system ATPase subunit